MAVIFNYLKDVPIFQKILQKIFDSFEMTSFKSLTKHPQCQFFLKLFSIEKCDEITKIAAGVALIN